MNPAFTSVIGEVKLQPGYGLSRHGAAAVVIARRAMKLKNGERLKCRNFLSGRFRSASCLPVRNRQEHVWRDWGRYIAARNKWRRAERELARSASLTAQPVVGLTADPSGPEPRLAPGGPHDRGRGASPRSQPVALFDGRQGPCLICPWFQERFSIAGYFATLMGTRLCFSRILEDLEC